MDTRAPYNKIKNERSYTAQKERVKSQTVFKKMKTHKLHAV